MYTKTFSAANPGCIILLIDCSGSMDEALGNAGQKQTLVAQNVNRVLTEIVRSCRVEGVDLPKERVEIAIIEYGEEVKSAFNFRGSIKNQPNMVNVADLINHHEQEMRKVMVPDGKGGVIEVEENIILWIHQKAKGGTPMDSAFEMAEIIATNWVNDEIHKNAHPPIIVNITDSQYSNNHSPRASIERIKSNVKTTDGDALVFNIHIENNSNTYLFPENSTGLNGVALELFEYSSKLPAPMVARAKASGFNNVSENSRGFIFNGDAAALVKFLEFNTVRLLSYER